MGSVVANVGILLEIFGFILFGGEALRELARGPWVRAYERVRARYGFSTPPGGETEVLEEMVQEAARLRPVVLREVVGLALVIFGLVMQLF